jgi:Pyruvate/2-oxoacid:ferredoxin oxidoreductase delta subunit
MNILKKLALVVLCTFGVVSAHADEGMWLPQYLKKDHAKALKKAGLKIPVTEIYNEERSSLKDAVVIFGRGCTGEIVSPDGLLLTNYHCGYSSIQQLSGIGHNYLQNGFAAMSRGEELPVEGLTVTFIREIVDVTEDFLASGKTLAEYGKEYEAKNAKGEPAPALDIANLCRAIGVKNVFEIDPFEIKELEELIKTETARDELSVIITKRPCAMIVKQTEAPMMITDQCKNCRQCMKIGCPAIALKDGKPYIIRESCVGCGLCSKVCPFDAIESVASGKEDK